MTASDNSAPARLRLFGMGALIAMDKDQPCGCNIKRQAEEGYYEQDRRKD